MAKSSSQSDKQKEQSRLVKKVSKDDAGSDIKANKKTKSASKKAAVKKSATKKAADKKAAPKKSSKKASTFKTETLANNTPQNLKAVESFSLLTEFDIALFGEGKHFRIYEKMGSHETEFEGVKGMYFAVWAPDAAYVSVIGNFNDWNTDTHVLFPRWDNSGIWEGFIPGLAYGELYKYFIRGNTGVQLYKGDPYANFWEVRPGTASITWELDYKWKDKSWMKSRKHKNDLRAPFTVYEVHLGSWRRPDLSNHEVFYTYKEITEKLVPYVKEMGFTHVELMPIMEHPFDGSWGYQITGYYAPTARYGNPQEFMEMVDAFHQAGIGVLLDWVPSHFPFDDHGLFKFDGSNVYEYADMRKGYHPDWNSYIFNYSRGEVRSFLLSNAVYWLDKYHIDGLRVDAVASIIHWNYSRKEGEWEANEKGGPENLEAIEFIQEMNKYIYEQFPDVQTIAEESTSFYGVSKPVYLGGLGFGMKWMMGWMNDTLDYFKKDPYFRQFHQNQLTFSIAYAFSENFMLPLSHDEVVHGKSPLIYKMPGDDWQKFANLRLMYTYMFTHPGTKLLFMGDEIAQTQEWDYKGEIRWDLLQHESHQGLQQVVKDLNKLYTSEPALYQSQFEYEGFEWVDITDHQQSIFVYCRKRTDSHNDELIIALNMTPIPRHDYKIATYKSGKWKEIFNSDDTKYFGSGVMNQQPIISKREAFNGRDHSLTLTLPPLGAIILKKV